MTILTPFFWLAALVFAIILTLCGSRGALYIVYPAAAGLLAAAAPLPARIQFAVFTVVLAITAIIKGLKTLFTKNS